MKLKDSNAFTTEDLLHLFMEGKRLNPVYFGYFLSESASKKLRHVFDQLYVRQDKKIRQKEQFGHITLRFAPGSPESLDVLRQHSLPLQIHVLLKRLYLLPGGISAFTVELPVEISRRFPQLKNPHITAYHSYQRQPFQSNALIANPESFYIDIAHKKISIPLHLGVFGNPYDSPIKMKQGMLGFLQDVLFKNIWEKKKQEWKKQNKAFDQQTQRLRLLQQEKKKTLNTIQQLQKTTRSFLHH